MKSDDSVAFQLLREAFPETLVDSTINSAIYRVRTHVEQAERERDGQLEAATRATENAGKWLTAHQDVYAQWLQEKAAHDVTRATLARVREGLTWEKITKAIAACDGTLLNADQPTVYHKMADAILALLENK